MLRKSLIQGTEAPKGRDYTHGRRKRELSFTREVNAFRRVQLVHVSVTRQFP
jgi:hypothetical protein